MEIRSNQTSNKNVSFLPSFVQYRSGNYRSIIHFWIETVMLLKFHCRPQTAFTDTKLHISSSFAQNQSKPPLFLVPHNDSLAIPRIVIWQLKAHMTDYGKCLYKWPNLSSFYLFSILDSSHSFPELVRGFHPQMRSFGKLKLLRL